MTKTAKQHGKVYTIKTQEGGLLHVGHTMGIWELPCVWMDDVNCHHGSVCVEIHAGKMYDAKWADQVEIRLAGQLLGWGNCDGGDQYDISVSAVPARVHGAVMRKLAEWTDLTLPQASE